MDRWLKSGSLKRVLQPNSEDRATCSGETPKKLRKYCESYLNLGFTVFEKEGEQKPQCVICGDVLSNEAMKPSKLRRHLETKHSDATKKPPEYFKSRLVELKESRKTVRKMALGSSNEKAVFASYEVSLMIAKNGQPHTIGEQLIFPAVKAITHTMFGDKYSKEISSLSLSNNTVKRRIDEMSADIINTLIGRVKLSEYFALQLDESTDIANNANLLCFVRYEFDNQIHEDMLFCKLLPLHTTAEALFEVLNKFIVENEIEWVKCVGICTDGAKAMVGRHKGLVARIQSVAPYAKFNHCCVHREALAARGMPSPMKSVLDEAVKIVNFIKSRPLNSRIFTSLCKEMGSDHEHLLLHSEIRWLSRGRVLTRLFELIDEVRLFLLESKFELKDQLTNFSWLVNLAYLADIFSFLNSLNSSLQGSNVTLFTVEDKIEATVKKLKLWSRRIVNREFDSFPTLNDFLETNNEVVSSDVIETMKEHLDLLASQLKDYFPPSNEKNNWMKNPFLESINDLSVKEEEQLIELSCDSSLKIVFPTKNLLEFWLYARPLYPDVSRIAVKHLLPFASTYLCESTFSALVFMKNKYRNKLDVEPDLRISVSSIQPNIGKLTAMKQHQPSH